jgi:hypothetical protein
MGCEWVVESSRNRPSYESTEAPIGKRPVLEVAHYPECHTRVRPLWNGIQPKGYLKGGVHAARQEWIGSSRLILTLW